MYLVEPLSIYDYGVITQNVSWKYLEIVTT